MFRIKESTEFVQTLSENLVSSETNPPKECPQCSHHIFHRHASYTRFAYMGAHRIPIVVPRFICTLCKRTTSILPDFVGSHQPMSWTVQEQVNAACETGLSAEEAALSVSPPTGPISARTVHRWKRKWTALLAEMQTLFWYAVLLIQANLYLPVGSDRPQSLYGWMSQVWQSIRMKTSTTCLFHFLHRLRHSSSSMIKSCTSHTTCLS
jgi:transposase-like protein